VATEAQELMASMTARLVVMLSKDGSFVLGTVTTEENCWVLVEREDGCLMTLFYEKVDASDAADYLLYWRTRAAALTA